MSRPTLSVVIPSYNGRALLATCLASIRRHAPGADGPRLEVIVVDDASSDDSARFLHEVYSEVRCIRLSQNQGFARAANTGIEAARGQFIQLLNNDTEVQAGWVEEGLRPFEQESIGSVAPLILLRRDPSRVDSAGDQCAFFGWPHKRGHGEPAGKWLNHGADDVFGPSGASAFYRTAALKKTGGYDTTFGAYYEDVDLAFRLRWAGYRCRFNPACRILHDISATYNHQQASLLRQMSRNAELLFWMNTPGVWFPAAIPARMAFLGMQTAWRIRCCRLRPFLEGKHDAWRLREVIRSGRRARKALAGTAQDRPQFPLGIDLWKALRNHRRRPPETTSEIMELPAHPHFKRFATERKNSESRGPLHG